MNQRIFAVNNILDDVPEEPTKKVFFENNRLNGAVWYIPPGEKLPAHYHPATDDVWVVLQGEGEYDLLEGESYPISKGIIAIAEEKQIHGIRAYGDEPLIFVAFSTPLPVEMIKLEE